MASSGYQLLLEDNTWRTRYNIPKKDKYSDTSTYWTLVSLNFTVDNYGIKLIYDQTDTPHADMYLSIISITKHGYLILNVQYFKDLFK